MTTAPTLYDVQTLREQEFPVTKDVIYLNHAGVSPIPRQTMSVVHDMLHKMSINPTGYWRKEIPDFYERFGEAVRGYINAKDWLEICTVTSTSTGFNLLANALPWQKGDNIIFCEGEFPSNVYPWLALRERFGVEVRIVPAVNGTLTLETLEQYADDRTRLVTVSAVQFFTGGRADLATLGQFCHDHNIWFAVDTIQAIGHIPIDVQAMHIDLLSTGAHKSLMALPAGGFIYARRELLEQMQPSYIGPHAIQGWEHWTKYKMDYPPREGALRFLMGTIDMEGMMSVIHNTGFFRQLGITNVDAHTNALAQSFIADFQARGLEVLTPADPRWHSGIVTVKVADDNARTQEILNSLIAQNVELVQHLDKDGNAFLRISVHCYNNEEDRQRFMNLLDALI